jgi:uncharacterized protein (UPF0264 family)
MRLLVSVRNAAEAAAALAGGADIVDAKEPLNGALGPVDHQTLAAITAEIGGRASVSAALGEFARDDIASGVEAAVAAGVAFVKVGFAGMRGRPRMADDVRAMTAGVDPGSLILVAYADYQRAEAPPLLELIAIAENTNAAGILLDTYDKDGEGLTALMTTTALDTFVKMAKAKVRFAALAGRLSADDIERVQGTSADIFGVRGAACDGGRSGFVTPDRVRALRMRMTRAQAIPYASRDYDVSTAASMRPAI